jgi:hypothetical protein
MFYQIFLISTFVLKNGSLLNFIEKIKSLKKTSPAFFVNNYEVLCRLVIKWICEIFVIFLHLSKNNQQTMFSKKK